MEKIRLNKFMSDSGVCSRRAADTLISSGKVRINGITAQVGTKVDPEKDVVFVNGKRVEAGSEKVYYILNKPVGYVTTSSDPFGRKKVIDLVPNDPRVYPIGRLDYDTSGLLILTNDGEFTHKLTHPRFEKEKEYAIVAKATKKYPISNDQCPIGDSLRDIFIKGIKLEEGIAKVDKIGISEEKGNMLKLNIVIHQGWNRQIRRMCEALGLEVISLKRIRIGELKLPNIKEGEYESLNEKEIKKYF